MDLRFIVFGGDLATDVHVYKTVLISFLFSEKTCKLKSYEATKWYFSFLKHYLKFISLEKYKNVSM